MGAPIPIWQDGVGHIMDGEDKKAKEMGMSNVVNLRQARKAKVRADKSRVADENRARFGRTKAQRQMDATEEQHRAALLDGARLDGDGKN